MRLTNVHADISGKARCLNLGLSLYIIRIYHECEGKIEKLHPEDRRLASQGLPSDDEAVIPRDRFFYPIFTWIMDSFSCLPLFFI